MIKGINRNVIEISDTGSELFERAILFVRPEGESCAPSQLEDSARSFLRRVRLNRRILTSHRVIWRLLGYLLAVAGGAGVAALVFCR